MGRAPTPEALHTGEGDDPYADPDEGPDDIAGDSPETVQNRQVFLPLVNR